MNQAELDRQFMEQAIEQAQLAAAANEVPVGAVLVRDGKVISKGFNKPITNHDPSAHAEMLALREAAKAEETVVEEKPSEEEKKADEIPFEIKNPPKGEQLGLF